MIQHRPLPARSVSAALLAAALLSLLPAPASLVAQADDDPFLWLEEVEGDRALDWVADQNRRARGVLRGSPEYDALYRDVLGVLTGTDRIAMPSIEGDRIYNFWTDVEHPRGVYRRTDWDSYLAGDPDWEVVLDVDALAEREGTPWAFQAMECLPPEGRLCLVSLSPGGSDAAEVREFDRVRGAFVEGGFHVPVSQNTVAWVDENTLLVSHSLDEERVTTSGFSAAARLWRRGTPLEEAAVVAEADRDDMGVFLFTQPTAGGQRVLIWRALTIFDFEQFLWEDGTLVRLDVPTDAPVTTLGDRLILRLSSDWTVGGETFPAGGVVSAHLPSYLEGRREVEAVLRPDARSTVAGIATAGDALLVNLLTDVQGRLLRFRRGSGGWTSEEIEVPPMGAVRIVSTSPEDGRFFFTYSSFIEPTTLYLAGEEGGIRKVRSLPHQFDPGGLTVEQRWATSADGTRVPYFVVRDEAAPADGTTPTLLTAYGGFQVSETPAYLGAWGKGWVERGGAYVLANIRGGGEFGPDWWKAALKENRQRAYDDFLAVAQELVDSGLTSPEHLGIMGGSNGGLLVGVAMTQRPDLFDAVVVQVPVADMKRYHTLLAGASWTAEFGDPDLPEEWAYIREYSPYQNLDPGADYPRPFIWTTTRDDRVHPGHARKLAAKMLAQGHEVLYFENVEGGHGSGVTPEQQAETLALSLAYLRMQLGTPGIS